MPKPGAKSKPTELKVLNGNPGKRKISDKEPRPDKIKNIPDPPHWLDYYAKKEWKRTIKKISKIGLLSEIDMSLFTVYCQTYSQWIRAEMEIMKNGPHYISPKGHRQKIPEVTIARDNANQLRMYAEVLGIGAASRSGMEIERNDPGPSVEEILNGNTG